MLVWGCGLTAYNPSTNQWRRLPDSPTRNGIVVWTGRELIGWGGGCCGDVSDDGSAYNPVTNTWRKIAAAPVSGQQSPVGAWTGRELVIFNGHGPEGARVGGAAYNPRTDSWRRIPSERRPQRYGDRGLRRERDPRARRASGRCALVQPFEQPLADVAADGARRRRSRRCLDGEPSACLGSVHAGLRSREGSLDDLRVLTAGVPRGSSGRVDGTRVDRLGRSGSDARRVHRLSRDTSSTELRSARRRTHRRLLSAASCRDTI